MNTFVFVVTIVAIVCIADTIQKIYKARAVKQESDVDSDEVNIVDFLALLGAWGPCPG